MKVIKEIIFRKKINGYNLTIAFYEGHPLIVLSNGDNEIPIYIDDYLDSYQHIKSKSYSLIGFKIGTVSFGSKQTFGIENLIQQYQNAVSAVEGFESALAELEISELEVSE